MKSPLKKLASIKDNILCGLFSKKEAANIISKGIRHLHSTQIGKKDPCAQITARSVLSGAIIRYPWEQTSNVTVLTLTQSEQRHQLIESLLKHPSLRSRRELREKSRMVLEEMITNSLYHAYVDEHGKEKFPRGKSVVFTNPREVLIVRYAAPREGVFLQVVDQGGRLLFENIARSLARCYGDSENQIENKESGAGLGLYLIYETVTHLKIETEPSRRTVFSCWISDCRIHSPETFSFNYFGKG